MTERELLKLRDLAEHTVVQLKERLTRDCKQEVVEEMVCMSNTRGGMIVIGINDKTGVVNPLSFKELQEFVVTFRRVETGEDNGEVDAKNGEDKPLNVNEDGLGDGRDDDRDDGGVVRVPYKDLPSQWKNVIQYCTIPRSSREIIAHLGYQYHSKYIAEIIRPLVKMNYLEMMVPDKPNSKNQKYRKVEK